MNEPGFPIGQGKFVEPCNALPSMSIGQLAIQIFNQRAESLKYESMACKFNHIRHLENSKTKKPTMFAAYRADAYGALQEARLACRDTASLGATMDPSGELSDTRGPRTAQAARGVRLAAMGAGMGVLRRAFKGTKAAAKKAAPRFASFLKSIAAGKRRAIFLGAKKTTLPKNLRGRPIASGKAANRMTKAAMKRVAGSKGLHSAAQAMTGSGKFHQGSAVSTVFKKPTAIGRFVSKKVSSPVAKALGRVDEALTGVVNKLGGGDEVKGPLKGKVSDPIANLSKQLRKTYAVGIGAKKKPQFSGKVQEVLGSKKKSASITGTKFGPGKFFGGKIAKALGVSIQGVKFTAVSAVIGGLETGDWRGAVIGGAIGYISVAVPVIGLALDVAIVASVAKSVYDSVKSKTSGAQGILSTINERASDISNKLVGV